jgi:hypothetical protein
MAIFEQGPKMSKMVSLSLVIFFAASTQAADHKYGGGTGRPNDPYLIYDANHLNAIGAAPNDWDKHFILMADIDLSGFTATQFNIIGYADLHDSKPFTGTFNGNDHTISNFTYESSDTDFVAMFAYVSDPNAEITNLTLVRPEVHAATGDYVGSLVGYLCQAHVRRCRVLDGDTEGENTVGGLVGCNAGEISECYFSGIVAGELCVGGLVGDNAPYRRCWGGSGRIYMSYSSGVVTGNELVGGLVGINGCIKYCGQTEIRNSYSLSMVNGNEKIGGLCGVNARIILNCYSAGLVSGNDYTGGLIGIDGGRGNRDNWVSGCYWDVQASGQATSAAGTAKTTAEMHDKDTFIAWGGCGNEEVWKISDGQDYPRLAWENQPGDLLRTHLFDFLTGAGTRKNPYRIRTADQLNKIGLFPCEWDKHFKLIGDIDIADFTGTDFNIIGFLVDELIVEPFSGVFDGCNHTISNFTYACTGRQAAGLFGYVAGPNAVIKNLSLIEPNVDASMGRNVGSLIGMLDEGAVLNCRAEGGNIHGHYHIGGLVGFSSGVIYDSHAAVVVGGTHYARGGLVGANTGRVCRCYAAGNVTGPDDTAGGLVGINYSLLYESYATGSVSGAYSVGGLVGRNCYGLVSDCYAIGSASGSTSVGGLAGWNEDATIANCYSTGWVTGDSRYSGGLVGRVSDGSVLTSFWDIQTSGRTTSAAGSGLTTSQMQDPNTFLDAGWDFVGEFENGPSDEWAAPAGRGYPLLWWQLQPLPPLPAFSGGAGTVDDPYRIADADDLNRIGHNPRLMSSHFKLISNIDLARNHFFIIGNRLHPFTGIFDGDNHQILGFHFHQGGTSYAGFFGYIEGKNATVKNLGLVAPNIDAGSSAASLAGYLGNGTIQNCYARDATVSGHGRIAGLVAESTGLITDSSATASVSNTWEYGLTGGLVAYNNGRICNSHSIASVTGVESVGGLVGESSRNGEVRDSYSIANIVGERGCGGLIGWNYDGSVANCYTISNVSGKLYLGGLIGQNYYSATLSNSFARASVTGTEYNIGGLVGTNKGMISNCYAYGDVDGPMNVGGLVGASGGDVFNCYSTAAVLGIGENVGGLVGVRWYDATVVCSFWDTEASGMPTSDGGTGLVTNQMQTRSTFEDAGWDFNRIIRGSGGSTFKQRSNVKCGSRRRP